MPRIPGTTNAQSAFLRAFLTSPTGPEPNDYPPPGVLRRWMRRPTFRQAFESLQQTLQDQTDLQLAEAARSAASCLADCVHTPEGSEDPIPLHVFRPLLSIIRTARLHRRPQRLDRTPTRSQPTAP